MAARVAPALLGWALLRSARAIDRLTIANACDQPIWIAHLANVGVGPGEQNAKIEPGGVKVFTEAETDGLGGARYWPKMGCDAQGNNCALGGSGGPSQACVHPGDDYSQCAPPIDTKFEATWGRQGQPCNPAVPSEMAGCDFVDVSLVDGWTLPFKLEVTSGKCTGKAEAIISSLDCSGMTVDKCPKAEDLGTGQLLDMTAISPHSGRPSGCYGPCLKLIDDKWANTLAKGRTRDDAGVVPYCCTTPPMTSETCNAGPIGKTKYVQAVHELCPGVYGFAYDDGMGLMRCSYGQYKMTFYCPGGGPAPAPGMTPPAASATAAGAAPAGRYTPPAAVPAPASGVGATAPAAPLPAAPAPAAEFGVPAAVAAAPGAVAPAAAVAGAVAPAAAAVAGAAPAVAVERPAVPLAAAPWATEAGTSPLGTAPVAKFQSQPPVGSARGAASGLGALRDLLPAALICGGVLAALVAKVGRGWLPSRRRSSRHAHSLLADSEPPEPRRVSGVEMEDGL